MEIKELITLEGIFESIENKGCLVAPTILRNIIGSEMFSSLSDENKKVFVRKVQKIMKEENINPGILGVEKCYWVCRLHNRDEMKRVIEMVNS